jgi:hypothetical protein
MNERLNELILTEDLHIFNGSSFDAQKPIPISAVDQLKDFSRAIIWVINKYESPICSSKGLGDFENKFLFDYYKQPIIEIDNCKVANNLISPGRVYYKAGWIDNADLRKLHKRMAEKIRRHFNKGLLPISFPFKFSDGIRNLLFKGYELELGHGGKKINRTNINES